MALVLGILLVSGTVLAGCLGEDERPAKTPDRAKKASTNPAAGSSGSDASKPKSQDEMNESMGKRWHFHNYWGLNPNLTVFDGVVTLSPQNLSAAVVPTVVAVGGVKFGLPYGRIIPPETGTVTVTILYNASPALGEIDVSYKPANLAKFVPAGTVAAGGSVAIPTTEPMADVPHRGRSVWEFRLASANKERTPTSAVGDVHVVVVATIGRPIFVDRPHIDHWKGLDLLPVLADERLARAAKTPREHPYLDLNASSGTEFRDSLAEFLPANGSVVPEGTRTLLARLQWTGTLPSDPSLLALEFIEENSGAFGAGKLVADNAGERLYKIEVSPRQTDNPYGNQSTWRFLVMLEGQAGAFDGRIRLDVWATRTALDEAQFPAAGEPSGGHPARAPGRSDATRAVARLAPVLG